jgi:hypothetical protein
MLTTRETTQSYMESMIQSIDSIIDINMKGGMKRATEIIDIKDSFSIIMHYRESGYLVETWTDIPSKKIYLTIKWQ